MRNYRAMTLIEMMIVIALITVITATALPKVNYTAYRVDSGARALRAAMQRAETFAVASQHNMLIAVDVPNGEMYVVEDANNNLAVDPGEHIVGIPLQDGVKFAAPPTTSTWAGAPAAAGALTGTTLITVTVHGNALPGFVFRCDGAASSDAQLYLTSKRQLVDDYRGINVTQATGRSDWYKDQAGSWVLAGF
jgi:prepilin-type N-terminal cleavage/methylation domain-containing protein